MLAPSSGISTRVRPGILAKLPPFSPIATRLMAIVADEDVSFKEVARLISLDPALAGEVLKLANSGLYGRRSTVNSVLHAIAIVGVQRLSQIVITAAIWKGLPRNPAPIIKVWWRHSIASALIAEHVGAKQVGIDYAYTAGLLHSIGQLALCQDSAERYQEVVDSAYSDGSDLLECERQVFGADHAELSGSVIERWDLPAAIRDAAESHHLTHAPASPLIAAVQTGCFAAEYIGFGACGCHRYIAAGDIPAPVTALIESGYLTEVLAHEVNAIECSLL